jgi:hypothetical protein
MPKIGVLAQVEFGRTSTEIEVDDNAAPAPAGAGQTGAEHRFSIARRS